MGLFDSFIKGAVNSSVGNDYRKIYFSRHPERYHYCNCCGCQLDREVPGEVTIDHIIPRKYGGTNAITNLQVLCRSCNSSKNDKINALALKYSGQALIREIRAEFR